MGRKCKYYAFLCAISKMFHHDAWTVVSAARVQNPKRGYVIVNKWSLGEVQNEGD